LADHLAEIGGAVWTAAQHAHHHADRFGRGGNVVSRLEFGASDYVVKRFQLKELVARRRTHERGTSRCRHGLSSARESDF
jgi:DNA-binding response OmpR family regulator